MRDNIVDYNVMHIMTRPIARLFDGLTDWLENQTENQAVGAHNRTKVCDFEKSGGL